ncbi:ribosome maturation factor RimM [Aquabacter cavernae]|uniref:ribosome maturation factor RimM n=1 Tax=Aquabacter cavernae TaxID=2496029 RepID=UPI00196A71CC|nr:ribosome maturation factor RimM [Aquabacter cavernae]
MTDRVLIARIGAPHGVRGEVRLFAFGEDPGALRDYALTDESGRRTFRIAALRAAKDHFVARLKDVDDRNTAEALTNTDLYVSRADLPPAEDEDTFYHADLIGLAVDDPAGARLGTVTAMHDFGAGDILEFAPTEGGTSRLVPFTKAAVPVVDLAGRRLVVDLPPEIEAREGEGDSESGED